VGVRLPSHLTASGRAILAALPKSQVRALYPNTAAFTARHETEPPIMKYSVLSSHLDRVRQREDKLPADQWPALAARVQKTADELSLRIHGGPGLR
ncbi:MAG: IclR family transcriptional regulator C-terminal domain-containing protein, partial [Arthrobacter oryzae]